MKLKKIFITVAIIAILSLTFVLAVSASEYDFISSNCDPIGEDYYLGTEVIKFQPNEELPDTFIAIVVAYDSVGNYYIRPCDFKRFVLWISGSTHYSSFISCCNGLIEAYPHLSTETQSFFNSWLNAFSGFTEEYFNKLVNYKEITQEELDAKDEQIANMSNSMDIIDGMYQEARAELVEIQAKNSELTTQNENLQSSVDELSGANTKLQYQIDSLEVQVADLVNDKTEINTQLMALDAKLEREVAKSYLQGYEDATGFNWMPVIGGLSVLSMVVTIISLCVRARKKKR